MTDREKLLDLIVSAKRDDPETGSFTEWLTDYLFSHGVTIQKWIPVTERLPTPVSKRNHYRGKCWTSETVLCVCVQNSGKRMVKEGRCEFYGDTPVWRIPGNIDSVTHWMPLPEPPKEAT